MSYLILLVQVSVETTIGFIKEAPSLGVSGFNVYHKNRLIRVCLHNEWTFFYYNNLILALPSGECTEVGLYLSAWWTMASMVKLIYASLTDITKGSALCFGRYISLLLIRWVCFAFFQPFWKVTSDGSSKGNGVVGLFSSRLYALKLFPHDLVMHYLKSYVCRNSWS